MKILIAGDIALINRLQSIRNRQVQLTSKETQTLFDTADLAIGNLEAPITNSKHPIRKTGPNLCSPPETGQILRRCGFDLLTLANNHILDFGLSGLSETIEALKHQGLASVGAGLSYESACRPLIHRANGIVTSILNFAENEWSTTEGNSSSDSAGACPICPVDNFRAIQDAKAFSDFVLVITHGGIEHYSLPTPRMKKLFRFYVEAGASAVINHHQHCISGYEIYRGSPIFYGVGNFLFDNPHYRNKPWNKGMIVELDFAKQANASFTIHHVDQCNESITTELCLEHERDIRNELIMRLNSQIEDDRILQNAFSEQVSKMRRLFQNYLEPCRSSMLRRLITKGLVPSFLSPAKRRLYLNLVRCESHREVLIQVLKDGNELGSK